MSKVRQISKEEFDRLKQSGVIQVAEQKSAPAPVFPPIVVEQPDVTHVAQAMADTAAQSTAQLAAMKAIIEQVSEQLRDAAGKPWRRINMNVVRDRNDRLKTIEIERVE